MIFNGLVKNKKNKDVSKKYLHTHIPEFKLMEYYYWVFFNVSCELTCGRNARRLLFLNIPDGQLTKNINNST